MFLIINNTIIRNKKLMLLNEMLWLKLKENCCLYFNGKLICIILRIRLIVYSCCNLFVITVISFCDQLGETRRFKIGHWNCQSITNWSTNICHYGILRKGKVFEWFCDIIILALLICKIDHNVCFLLVDWHRQRKIFHHIAIKLSCR